MGKLIRRFEFLRGASEQEVLQHARKIAGEIDSNRKGSQKTATQVDEKNLLAELSIVLQSRSGKPHHAVIHALGKFGYGYGTVSNHFGTSRSTIIAANKKAKEILVHPIAEPKEMAKSKIMDKLDKVQYRDLDAFLHHMSRVSRQVLETPKPTFALQKARTKTAYAPSGLAKQVAEVAHLFIDEKSGRYKQRRIALHLLGKEEKEVEKEELEKKSAAVGSALASLIKRGIVPRSVWKKAKIFNPIPSSEEIEQHRRIVRRVLKRGHPFIRSYWKYLDKNEAEHLGMLGVVTALQRFDPDKGVPFERYAPLWIAQRISREVRKRAIRARRETSLDASRGAEGEYTLHDKIAAPALEPHKEREYIEKMFKLYRIGGITRAELAVGALLTAGHNQTDLSRFFGTSRERISQIKKRMIKELRRFTQE